MKNIKELIKIICLIAITISVVTIAINTHKDEKECNFKYDINNDGRVNSQDLLLLKQYLVENNK